MKYPKSSHNYLHRTTNTTQYHRNLCNQNHPLTSSDSSCTISPIPKNDRLPTHPNTQYYSTGSTEYRNHSSCSPSTHPNSCRHLGSRTYPCHDAYRLVYNPHNDFLIWNITPRTVVEDQISHFQVYQRTWLHLHWWRCLLYFKFLCRWVGVMIVICSSHSWSTRLDAHSYWWSESNSRTVSRFFERHLRVGWIR